MDINTGVHHDFKTVNSDYGQDWFNTEAKNLSELGDNELKLKRLEKSLKGMRRLEKRKQTESEIIDEETKALNEKLKYNKNAIIAKKFPFKADEFKYPNENRPEPTNLYITNNDIYGSQKPNQLELPGIFIFLKLFYLFNLEKFFPMDCQFTKDFSFNMYKNNSLNTKVTRSKAHKNLDTVI